MHQLIHLDMQNQEIEREARPGSNFRLALIILALDLVLFLSALDQTVVAYVESVSDRSMLICRRTAIPTISNEFKSSTSFTWIGGSYLLASAAAGPIWTKCSDIWGRKSALLSAVFIFAVSSLVAALSINMDMLIAARALQGAAGGGILLLVSICTSDLFSLRRRALFIGLQGGVYAVAGSAGPLIGGTFAQYVSWRWCFWINLPFCAISFILLFLMDTHNPRTLLIDGLKAMDWFGIITMLGMSLLFLLGLDFGPIIQWNSPTVISLLIISIFMIAAFIISQKKATYPLMPLKVFTILSNNAVILVAASHSMISIGVEYYLPLYFQNVKQQTPFKSGLLLLPLMISAASSDVISGLIISKTGRYREIIWIGVITMTLGTGLYTFLWVDTPITHIIGIEITSGIGVALLFQAPMLAIHNTVKQSDVASATASLGFIRALSTASSVVIGGVVFQSSQHSTPNPFSNPETNATGIRHIFILYAGLGGVALLASIFLKQGHMSTEHEETRAGIRHLSKN